jgi:hypothetical protein
MCVHLPLGIENLVHRNNHKALAAVCWLIELTVDYEIARNCNKIIDN